MSHTTHSARGPRSTTPRRRGAAISFLLAGAVVVAGCGGSDVETAPVAEAASATESSAPAAFGRVSPAEAAAIAVEPGVEVIDVRTPEEYAEGHLDGATLIDFYSDTFADDIAALDPDGEYLIYCRSGNRSGQAFDIMQQLGFEQVWDLDGGVLSWGADGLPLVP